MGGQGGTSRGRPRLEAVTVDEIVQTDVVTARPDDDLSSVVSDMAREDVGSVVVVEDDSPIGVVTDRSIALCLQESSDVSDRTVGDLVSGDLVTGTTEMSVFDVLQQLEDAEIRRLPIVEDDELAGIITLDDILYLLGAELEHATSIIEAQSPRL